MRHRIPATLILLALAGLLLFLFIPLGNRMARMQAVRQAVKADSGEIDLGSIKITVKE